MSTLFGYEVVEQAQEIDRLSTEIASLTAEIERLREALKALQRQVLQGAVRGDEWMDEALELTRAALQPKEINQ